MTSPARTSVEASLPSSTRQAIQTVSLASRPPGWEWPAAIGLIAAFLAFNLATYNMYPEVWCDEVWFSEPALNLIHYGSFTTMVYQFQDPGTFPALNCPLYLMALAPWLKLAGTTVLAVRSFNYTLMAVSAFLIWLVSWKFNLVKSARARLLMVALLHLGYGMSFAYRCSRPDILGLVGLLLMLFSFRVRRRPLRDLCLTLSAALTVWIGLQVALFAWFACLIAWPTTRWTGLRELVLLSAGMALGAAALVVFFASKGVLPTFLLLTTGILGKHYVHAHGLSAGAKILKVLTQILVSNVDDFTTLGLTLALGAVFLAARQYLSAIVRSLLVFALALVFSVPALFNVVGHYAFYYSYARFVPAAVAFFAVCGELHCFTWAKDIAGNAPRWLKLLCIAALAVGTAMGLPLRLAITVACAQVTPRAEVQRIIRQQISPGDVVFSDYAYFFEVKRTAKVVYDRFCSPVLLYTPIPGRDLTSEQKKAVSVLVIRPHEKEFLTRYFGGDWTAASDPFGDTQEAGALGRLPLVGQRFVHYLMQRQTERYQVQIFRRVAHPGA